MFKEWLKQFLAMCICVITLLSSICPAVAEDYVMNDQGDDATYYIIDGKDVDDLFDFSIYDVDEIVNWIFQFKSYTVIKKYTDNGDTVYKMYFNTPNLQSILKNRVISLVNDGYTDDTYIVDDTEWVVDVGLDAPSENVITKYGFNVPSYTYMGEYPKVIMSTAGILPSPEKWYEVLWRAIKTLFGVSFIEAPDADNFNTITYLNHTYTDRNDYILEFFKLYYLDYFEKQIPTDYIYADDDDLEGEYFSGPDEVIELAVTKEVYDRAVEYNAAHQDEYDEACQRYTYWNEYVANGNDAEALTSLTTEVGTREYDSWHFLASIDKYRMQFTNWVNAHPSDAYVLLECFEHHDWKKRWGGSGVYLAAGDYKLTKTAFSETEKDEAISLAADIHQYAEDYLQADISYYVYTYRSENGGTPTQVGDPVYTTEDDVSYADTASYRDDSDYTSDAYNISNTTEDVTSINPDTGQEEVTGTMSVCTYNVNKSYSIRALHAEGSDHTMTYASYKDFLETCSYNSITYEESDFVPTELQAVYDAYNANADLIEKYELFNEMLARGDNQDSATNKKELLYRQCMITNEGEDGECWSQKYGDEKTSLTLVNVYAYSRIYTVTEDYSDLATQLNDADAHEILTMLQSYCGPYYPEVVANMMKLMCATAKNEGDLAPTLTVIADDKRVMPYDTSSMLSLDRENYDVTDPRVELYKSHVVGKLISKFSISPLSIGIYIKPQKTIISFAGKITELSVFMQQLCNFNILDSYGLSPADMWQSGYVTLATALLALFFIIKTVIAIFKMGSNAGARTVLAFFILILELGIITAISLNPTKTWNMVKNVENKLINLGEMITVYSIPSLTYLYGSSSDMEVTYYMPYLDTWSKYNTGYGILDDEQLMDATTDAAELVDKDFPKIGTNEVQHYSVLLMDSFSYWGYSNSLSNSILVNGSTYNGNTINNNAYRVVDHFMAPRVAITDNGTSIHIDVTQNENYNGAFQSGIADLLPKLLNCILCCFLSLVKFLTFMWQWFMLYIFLFKVILGRGAENKKMSTILLEVFSPTIALIFIGMYSGMVMIVGMSVEGLIGICVEIFLFWLTFMMIRWWHDLTMRCNAFPATLGWLYMLTNLSAANRMRMANKMRDESEEDALDAGMEAGWSKKTLDEQREELFESNGQLKARYANDSTKEKVIKNWYARAYNTDHNPNYGNISDETRNAMRNLESDDKFRDGINRFKKSYKYGGSESSAGFDSNNDHNSSGKIKGKRTAADMYNNSSNNSDDVDDFGRKKTGSGDNDSKSSPKKIGASDNEDKDSNPENDQSADQCN